MKTEDWCCIENKSRIWY